MQVTAIFDQGLEEDKNDLLTLQFHHPIDHFLKCLK
jgi:hypothetical protein